MMRFFLHDDCEYESAVLRSVKVCLKMVKKESILGGKTEWSCIISIIEIHCCWCVCWVSCRREKKPNHSNIWSGVDDRNLEMWKEILVNEVVVFGFIEKNKKKNPPPHWAIHC